MRPLLLIWLLLYLTGCSQRNEKNKTNKAAATIDTTFHLINAFGHVSGDTSKFWELNCGLYLNNKGILAFKAVDNSYRMDTTGKGRPLDVYLTTIYNADSTDTLNAGEKEMKYVVDTTSFKVIGSFYLKDKNHIYDFNPMLDGGSIGINSDADLKTFHLLESEFFAKDKKHCYYRGRIIEGADLNSFKVLDTSYSSYIAYDKKNYYDGEDKMSIARIKEQNLDSIRRKKNGL